MPEVGSSSVISILIVVVLPAPFGPSSPNSSPRSTANETPRTASTVERLAPDHAGRRPVGPPQFLRFDHGHGASIGRGAWVDAPINSRLR